MEKTTKKCKTCGVDKPIDAFHSINSAYCKAKGVIYKTRTCKLCTHKRTNAWRRNNPGRAKLIQQRHMSKNRKHYEEFGMTITAYKCTSCGIIKSTDQFNKNIGAIHHINTRCKTCTGFRGHWLDAKRNDARKGFQTCSWNEWRIIVENKRCYYECGLEATGIDRIDNAIGHVVGNMLPCCTACNLVRRDLFTVEEMKQCMVPALRQIYLKRGMNV